MQKSRADWITFGDRNIRFYHAKAVIRKRRNKIRMLQIGEDMWCDDENLLREAAVDYFENLFTDCPSPSDSFPTSGSFHVLNDEDISFLNAKLTNNEINDALFPCCH
ncbi:hypothetical protein V6N13_129301 [Hibiscus sabdariffa]